jgi:hypothetical protein
MQSYANELMLCMLSCSGEDTGSPGYERMEQLVAAHVSSAKLQRRLGVFF